MSWTWNLKAFFEGMVTTDAADDWEPDSGLAVCQKSFDDIQRNLIGEEEVYQS